MMDDNMGVVHTPIPGSISAAAKSAQEFLASNLSFDTVSRATSPGVPGSLRLDDDNKKRYRQRTFSYFNQLPYPVEDEAERDATLAAILKNLYISIKAEDFAPGAIHWSRELQGWLGLKFDMTRDLRASLAKLYYHLALAPGLESTVTDRFGRMLICLTKKKHYLKPGDDLILDWHPLWKQLKSIVLPSEIAVHQSVQARVYKQILRLCLHVQSYLDPGERREMLDEILPYFSTPDISNSFVVFGLLTIMVPTTPAPPTQPESQPEAFLPTYFHLWSLVNRSKAVDVSFLDILSRLARDHLTCDHVHFTEHGIFTKDQSDLLFTSLLRLTEIPVGQANSPYVSSLSYASGLAVFLDKDRKKYPIPYMAARWIVHSLSPSCLLPQDDGSSPASSVLTGLEGFLQSIDTFFHPSNQGAWTSFLAQFTHHLADIFVNRWNREQSGELNTPASRRISPELKRRFVLALRDVTFMGLFGKSQKVTGYYYVTLQCLAFLEPSLILPGALQRFYPSLQGLVEVHRTTASLCGLQMIAHILSREKGFRCHVTALLALALPGIDANDLGKTQNTLSFIQSVAHTIPFASLTSDEGEVHDTGLAVQWVQGEMERFEREGQDVEFDYNTELSDEMEARILRSSTAGFGEFILALLGKVFTLVENLPDSAHVRSGSPEDNVINSLPAAFTPLFASLSPELFDIALEKLATFVGSHVVNQARDAMAWIINALCKVNPEKALKVFVPMLIVNIRSEIDYNGAASDRSSGADVLPRDRALVWYVSILSMCVVHVGGEVLKYKDELLSIAQYMQEKCRGLPTLHVSNFVHHLLLNLTQTYTIDNAMFEPDVVKDGVRIEHWGYVTPPSKLTIKWYRPSQPEIQFATELFESQVVGAKARMEALMSREPPVSRKGKNKEWSDELSRALSQIRLVISGVSALFDPARASTTTGSKGRNGTNGNGCQDMEIDDDPVAAGVVKGEDEDTVIDDDTDPLAEVADDDELRRQFTYPAGYLLDPKSELFERIHKLREEIGYLLSQTHKFLSESQEDDVTCFTALYSTYRIWITDVGFERSAHPLDRLLRLYRSDTASFKINGLRKAYPRALLVKRADAYQLQRVKYNSTYRLKSDLDKRLLLDLAESCTSLYAEVRRVAQSSQDSSLKVLIGGRPLVIPVLLDKLRSALAAVDHDRIKGAMYTLLFTSLVKTLMRDWRFAPTLMRLYIETAAVDKTSIQNLCASAVYPLLEFGQAFERMVIFDHDMVNAIAPTDKAEVAECASKIERRHTFIVGRRAKVEKKKAALGLELAEKAKTAHWKVAMRCAVFANNMCLRFESLAAPAFIDLVAKGAVGQHPTLRSSYQSAFSNIFMFIDRRAVYNHDYKLWLLEKELSQNKLEILVPPGGGDAEWTRRYLDSFSQQAAADEGPSSDGNDAESKEGVPEYFVDSDYPGWLAWGKSFVAYRAKPAVFDGYDETEKAARSQIGAILTKDWLRQCLDYMKQEPRDAHADRFKVSNVSMLTHVFELVHSGLAAVTFDEVKALTLDVYGDGSDRHQHRATAEILAALLSRGVEEPREYRDRAWAFAAPMLLQIINDKLTPENLQYWMTCVHMITGLRDPRRSRELVQNLSTFRLDVTSNAAFKDSSKVSLLEFLISDAGWHFRDEQPILEDLLAHLDHPYKAVREAMGRILATIYRTRYYEAFPTVAALLEANKAASSIGIRPYKPTEQFSDTVAEVFGRLERWRLERVPGQQEQSSYTSGSKTVLIWLDWMLSSQECTQLVDFFPEPFIDQLLHMMDVKEDPELMRLAYHVYRHLPNVPLREGEDDAFIRKLTDVGRSASSWHQRLRALINMQVVYFRRLFLTRPSQRKLLFDSVGDMLADSQLEVRDAAAATLAGMIRCSPSSIRNPIIQSLKLRFQEQLRANPMPKRKRALAAHAADTADAANAAGGRDTPVDVQRQVVRRHAAVLGLGALIEAFPYATPPPEWMPEVLAHLATRTANDPGVVGNATKSILAEFKKTRQDSWTVDQKYFTSEQLEDLEGVLWKSYFA